jgi:hypothetical protein
MKLRHRIKKATSRFQKELKKQIRYAVAAGIGFLIAWAWKEYVFNLATKMTGDLALVMPNMSNFIAAATITLIGVVLIFISSRLLD